MKKFTIIPVAFAGAFSLTMLLSNTVSAQSSRPIPDNVVAIAKKSCVHCHAEPGKSMALAHVNISKWDTYTAEKQASKAKAMCNMVTKGKMPPNSFKSENPGFVLTKEEIKTICDWSTSIQIAKK